VHIEQHDRGLHIDDEQPKFLARCAQGIRIFCRTFGLTVVYTMLRGGRPEPQKVAISRSRLVSVVRAFVHLIPVTGAIFIIYINLRGYYIGAYLRNIAYLQFAAKLHELLIQASLAAILSSYIRYELALGAGLPFGALFSALQITQVSYLWSTECWGALLSFQTPLRRRLCLFVVVAITILLATAAGPASALALIPRVGYWPAGSTHIWLNGTRSDLWPDFVNESIVPLSCSETSMLNGVDLCPSSGWQEILKYVRSTETMLNPKIAPQGTHWSSNDLDSLFGFRGAPTHNIQEASMVSLRTMTICTEKCSSTTVTTQQAIVSDALVFIALLWNNYASFGTKFGNRRNSIHSVQTFQPITGIYCSTDNDPIHGMDDERPILFEDLMFANLSYTAIDVTRAQLMQLPQNTSDFRVVWTDIARSGPEATTGAIVLHPRDPQNLTQSFTACWLESNWGPSTVNTSTGTFGGEATATTADSIGTNLGDLYGYQRTPRIFAKFKHIKVTKEWAQFLNPFIPELGTTVFHILLSNAFEELDTWNTEIILAALMTNGLAMLGRDLRLQGHTIPPEKTDQYGPFSLAPWLSGKGDLFHVDPVHSANWAKLEINSSVEGLFYSSHGFAVKLAIGILTAYIVFAVSHFIYACFSGISSSSWDSIAEVTALAVNSPPTEFLKNTCAGIENAAIFSLPVRVLAADADSKQTSSIESHVPLIVNKRDHLQLVFGKVGDEDCLRNRILPNKKYGTL
jgi:hypothetical protein